MSANNTIKKNNEKNHNNEGRRNNFSKRDKQPKVNPNEIKLPLYLPADLDEKIANEILNVLDSTKFNKISIPVGTYRGFLEDVDEGDNRVCTIGYIRNYNAENNEFTVVVFSKFTNTIKEFGDIAMELAFNIYKNALGTITKFNIVPVVYGEIEGVNEEINE